MTDPNRRLLLGGMIGAVGISATASTPGPALPAISDPIIDTVKRQMSDLSSVRRSGTVVSPDLQRMFDGGMVQTGPGQCLVLRDPVRAIAMVPVRYKNHDLSLPITAMFAGSGAEKLTSLALSPNDPFDALRSPISMPADTVDLQTQYDRLVASGGGTLTLGPGRFATNLTLHSRQVHLSGAGRGATQLVPLDPARPVLQAQYRDGSWNYVTIANMDIGGSNGRGIGFAAGADAYVPGDEFAGRTRFVNVGFADLSIAIRRNAGQIGLILEQCGFGTADYHLHSIANRRGRGDLMHAGVLSARDCHFTGARVAMAHIDSPIEGTGAVLFDNCIMERNPGFVFHVPAFANTDATTDFVVRDCWNERNATSTNATIDGRRTPVRYGFFANVGMIRFDGTPLGALTLRNAVVETWRCPLDNLATLDQDDRSTIRHHQARGFGSYAPIGMTEGIAAAAQSDPPGRALSFIIPSRTTIGPTTKGKVLMSERSASATTLVGTVSVTTQSVQDAVLPGIDEAQRLSLRRGMQVFPDPVAVPPGSWLVWLFTSRLLSGSGPFFQVSGDRGISARRRLASTKWETLGGMAEVPAGAKEISLWLIQEDDAAELLLGGYNLVSFANRQSALDFLNSNVFAV